MWWVVDPEDDVVLMIVGCIKCMMCCVVWCMVYDVLCVCRLCCVLLLFVVVRGVKHNSIGLLCFS